MPRLVQSSTSQSTAFTRLRLRWIVVWVLVSLIALLAIGIVISLLWPDRWSPLVVSLILNVVASLIGAAVAILTAIFVVQKFLDDRNREQETKKAQYHASWTIVQYQHIKVVSFNITHICLFVAFGKERYLQLADYDDADDIPDSIGDFIPAFTRILMEGMEKYKETENSKKRLPQDREIWGNWKQAFASEVAARVSCSTRDIDMLLHMLRGYKINVQNLLYLIQPFMLDKMGMAYALIDLSYELGLTIDTIERHMAAEIANNPNNQLHLCEAVTSRIVSLGHQAVKVKEMILANQDDDLSAVSDQFSCNIKTEPNV